MTVRNVQLEKKRLIRFTEDKLRRISKKKIDHFVDLNDMVSKKIAT